MRRTFLSSMLVVAWFGVALGWGQVPQRSTHVFIAGESFQINGQPTYQGCSWAGRRIEGLLLNARLVQGIFDDRNPETVGQWAYPDSGVWDPDRNTDEFVAAMAHWRSHGLLAFTINLQGGCPKGYCSDQPWSNSAILPDGQLDPSYMDRLKRILDRADELEMVVILGLYYFGQDQAMADEAAVIRGVDEAVNWVLDHGYRNVLIEINNECDLNYDHAILRPSRVHELISRVQNNVRDGGYRLLAGTSFSGGKVPTANVVQQSDFVLLHGNGVSDPQRLREMVATTRSLPGYRPMPILFNEDDHYQFERQDNNMAAALDAYASWGFFDPGQGNYRDGFQYPPVDWEVNTAIKQAFFCKLSEITASAATQRGLADSCCGNSQAARYQGAETGVAPPLCGPGVGPAAMAAALLLVLMRVVR